MDNYLANKIANNLFVSALMKKYDALEYLVNRGLTEETILRFQLGYACSVITILKSHGLPYSHLATLDGEHEYFVNRITIPIIEDNKIIGFTSRAFPEHEKKHMHQRGLDLSFYNADRLKENYVVIVESPICCMTLEQCGIYSVALCGSSRSNIKKINKETKIYLLPDIDSHRAGEKEFIKFAVKLRHEVGNPFIKIAYLSDDYSTKTDTNSFMLSHKPEDMKAILRNAVDIENHRTIEGVSFNSGLARLMQKQTPREIVFNNKLKEVKEKIDIVELFKEYTEVIECGNSYACRCLFHSDKTPSLMIYPDTKSWYCFGCNVGGDIIEFIKKIENVEFQHALALLYERIKN